MITYAVTKWSGVFRYEPEAMTSEEVKEFVLVNRNDREMYVDESYSFGSLADARIYFEEAKKHLIIRKYPSNKVMNITWITLEEERWGEDAENVSQDGDCIDECYPEKE
jgi:hypothetical protein